MTHGYQPTSDARPPLPTTGSAVRPPRCEPRTMSELELLVALRLRDIEFEHRFGMSASDAATAAGAVRGVLDERGVVIAPATPRPEVAAVLRDLAALDATYGTRGGAAASRPLQSCRSRIDSYDETGDVRFLAQAAYALIEAICQHNEKASQ